MVLVVNENGNRLLVHRVQPPPRESPVSAVIQIVRFRTSESVEQADAVAMNERFQREVAPVLPGLERREAAITPDGEWVLVLRYSSMQLATAPPADHGMEVAGLFMSMIDMSTMSASFQTIVSE